MSGKNREGRLSAPIGVAANRYPAHAGLFEIYHLTYGYEFPRSVTRALELAVCTTWVPSIYCLIPTPPKKRRMVSIEATRIRSWPPSHLSTVDGDTPSAREIRAFFHCDRSAKIRKRAKSSTFSGTLRSFLLARCLAINSLVFLCSMY
jgi:hypothetical protein